MPSLPASSPTGCPGGQLTAFDPLPKQGLIEGSQRLIRGPVALEAIATLGRGDILLLGGRITALAGDYRDGEGKHTLIVATYPDRDAATAAFRNLTARLDPAITPLAVGGARLVFRDYDGTFGVASRTGSRLDITLHLTKQPPPD